MNNLIFHQTTLDDFRLLISEAVEAQCKKCQMNKRVETEKLFTRKETAKTLQISLPTLSEYTRNGIIKSVRMGSCIRYRQSDIDTALISVQTTSKTKQ